MTTETNKPVQAITVKPLTLSVWANEHADQNGEIFTAYSIDIQRCYKEQDSGEFKYTRSLRPQDLSKLTVLALAGQKIIETLQDNHDKGAA